jgi:hypothetical protein
MAVVVVERRPAAEDDSASSMSCDTSPISNLTTSHSMVDPQPSTSHVAAPEIPNAAAVKAAKRTGNSIIVNKRQVSELVLLLRIAH